MELLQIMIFSIGNFDQKIFVLDFSKKKPLSHFGQVVFNMINLNGDLFD